MEIIIQSSPEDATTIAARLVASLIKQKPDAVLGLATGSTPLRLYRAFAAMKLDWRKITTFNLDEYIGLPEEHPHSYHAFMWENLFNHVNITKKNIHIPDGMTRDIPKFCAGYEKRIAKAGGIDLQILGIGSDGHIGFNEPTSSLSSRTRIKTLTQQTIKDNARFFGSEDKVPRHVITMGIGTIMEAKHCLMLAFGKGKSHAIAEAVEGPITSMNPASTLQMHRRSRFAWTRRRRPNSSSKTITSGCTAKNRGGSRFDLRIVKPTLLVTAAEMGSRYRGLKQINPTVTNGKTTIDYSNQKPFTVTTTNGFYLTKPYPLNPHGR